eukprot:scaffold840_cov57-Phaeocystis_antarctica.AAC.1
MNLGSIIGLGSVCQPFPAGLTTLSGGHQWRSIDPWIQQSRSMDPSVSGSKCPELAPSSLRSLIRSWGAPQAMGVSWKRPLSTYASQPMDPWIWTAGSTDQWTSIGDHHSGWSNLQGKVGRRFLDL